MKLPFVLPAKPVDGYEVRLFSVNVARFRIDTLRYVYHVDKAWRDVIADADDDRPGKPFVDEWQVYYNGDFTGRIDGWTGLDHFVRGEPMYATMGEARAALFECIKAAIRLTEEQLEEYRAILARVEREGIA